MSATAAIEEGELRRLHPDSVTEPERVRALLERARLEAIPLRFGIHLRAPEGEGRIEALEPETLRVAVRGTPPPRGRMLLLSVTVDGIPLFFAAPCREVTLPEPDAAEGSEAEPARIELGVPAVLYRTERRDRPRERPEAGTRWPRRVALETGEGLAGEARVEDASVDGLGLELPRSLAPSSEEPVRVRLLDGEAPGAERHGWVRSVRPSDRKRDWVRLGLSVTRARPSAPPPLEPLRAPGAAAGAARRLPPPRVVEHRNARGEPLRGLLDVCGDPRGGTAVVVPPYWGRTKETVLPLAATLVESFRRAGEPLAVLRYDGIRRRGESYKDPGCRERGRETVANTMSQNVEDLETALDFLERSPDLRPARVVLLSFSFVAIHVRHLLARRRPARVAGWISLAGATDLQDLFRSVSAGVDYVGGVEKGLRFGERPVLGVLLDVDRFIGEAIDSGQAFLEDARRDMERIDVPLVWFSGAHDAWVDRERVRHLLGFGETAQRRLVDMPTGHILRTSETALAVFREVAREVALMGPGRAIEPVSPDAETLEARRAAEAGRLRDPDVDLQAFWRDYLLGRDGTLGFELMASTSQYQEALRLQTEGLALRGGERVADLGAGTGAFPAHLASRPEGAPAVEVHEVDFVGAALARARRALEPLPGVPPLRYLRCDLGVREGIGLPLRSGSYDRVLASFLVNYLRDPRGFLQECGRLLRPGGRLVLSSLRRDADVSKAFHDWARELQDGRARHRFGEEGERVLVPSLRGLLDDISRLVELEDAGHFHFWSDAEIRRLCEEAGFRVLSAEPALGNPPQAVVLVAEPATGET